MSNKILIIGGAGFIGSSLAIGLKKLHPEWQITCLDNLRRRGSELNLPRLKKNGIKFMYGDIRNSADLEPTAFKVETMIDCAAEPAILAGYHSPQYVLQTNLLGTVNILELARQINANIIFLSTSRVYPVEPLKAINLVELPTRMAIAPFQNIPGISELGINENFTLNGYRTIYGTSKLASEMLITEYRQAYNIQGIINRCGMIAGPWQMGKVDQGVHVLWIASHHFQRPLKYISFGGQGKQVRDVLHVQDLLQLINYQLANFTDLDGEIFNVGGGIDQSLSLLETTHLCEAITGKKIAIESCLEERLGDIPIFITDITKVRTKTGWEPQIKPQQILQDIYDWILAHETALNLVL